MNAQAGVFYFDRRPVAGELVTQFGHLLDPFGPDGGNAYVADGVAMIHRALRITAEDQRACQPYTSAHANVITWDGRLDNRHDLLSQVWRDLRSAHTDAALALAVYERWGGHGLSRLVGDWSCVILDRAQDVVTLASDFMGIRPLYLYVRPDLVSWATTLECLVEQWRLHDALDPRYMVGTLSAAIPPGLTPYRDVVAIPAGCALTVARQGTQRTTSFWTFDVPQIRYRRMGDYADHLRTLFFGAVRSRLRARTPVWAELSGGLDSSSIVCAAYLLMQTEALDVPRLESVSYVSAAASADGDERRYVAAVDTFCGRSTHYLVHDVTAFARVSARSWVTPRYPSGAFLEAYDLVRRSQGHVFLGGEGGDIVMGNFRDHHDDIAGLLPGHPFKALALARARALGADRSIWRLLSAASAERLPSAWLLPRRVETAIHRSGARDTSDAAIADLFALKTDYVSHWRAEREHSERRALELPDVSHRRMTSELRHLADGRYMQSASEEPLVLRSHPYLDRRLVEFVLGIPVDVLAPPGQPRGLMKRAFDSFVPDAVIRRFSKGYVAPSIVRNARTIVAAWLEAPDALRVSQLECVDRSRLRHYLESVRDNAQSRMALFLTLYALEHWLAIRADRSAHRAQGTNAERCVESVGRNLDKRGGDNRGISKAIA